MMIQSTRLGTLEVNEKDILRFVAGLPGFPEEKAFVFLPYSPESPFAFLQSVTEPNLTFLIVYPFAFFSDYQFEITDKVIEDLGIVQESPPQVFNIVTVPAKPEAMTANLLAPVVINWEKRSAAQVILESTSYTTSHRLFPNGFPERADKEAL